MLIMAVPEYLSKKLEAHMGDPRKMFEIVCENNYKKVNNKMSNLCKKLKSCTFKDNKAETDYWFTFLSRLN